MSSVVRRLFLLAACVVLLTSRPARADLIAYEGFAYPAGAIDTRNGGTGWDTGFRTLGSGGNDTGCDNSACTCPEVPSDTRVTRGHSGDGWTTSALNAQHNTVRATGLTYPGLPVTGGSLKLIYVSAPSGGWRSFRTIDTTTVAAQPLAASYANGPGQALRGTFGKSGTTIWFSFLAAMDCGGATCTSSATSNNGGIHLFDGIGDLDVASGNDGPKHPFEHLQLGDRNTSSTWIAARTTGGCVSGSSTWQPVNAASQPIPFDSATHLFVVRMRFDVASPATATCAPGISGSGTCSCPASNPTCLDEIAIWIDPDLSGAVGAAPAATASTGVLPPTIVADFQFDTVQVGAEGEAIDLDEIRVGTTYADVVGAGGPFTVYRAASPAALAAPANAIASAPAAPYDDSPPPDPLDCYEVDNGSGRPSTISLSKVAGNVRISWP